jgi:hypothetical protein
VIGGQLFSRSFRGLTVYKLEFFGIEGLLASLVTLVVPFIIFAVLAKYLPLWSESEIDLKSAQTIHYHPLHPQFPSQENLSLLIRFLKRSHATVDNWKGHSGSGFWSGKAGHPGAFSCSFTNRKQ